MVRGTRAGRKLPVKTLCEGGFFQMSVLASAARRNVDGSMAMMGLLLCRIDGEQRGSEGADAFLYVCPRHPGCTGATAVSRLSLFAY